MASPSAPTRSPAPGRGGAGIVTPEAVLLEFAEAGLGSRSLAFLVDLAVRGAIVWGVLFATSLVGFLVDETLAVVVLIGTGFGVLIVYPIVCETIWNGRTPGKMAVGLRVVTIEGAPVRFRHAAIRSALGMIDFVVSAGSIAILSALATRQSQRLGDLAAGTIVIRERQAGAHSQPIVFQAPPGWEGFTASVDVAALADEGYVLIRSFLLRVHELRPEARWQRGVELATLVASTLGVDVPPGAHPEAFLVSIASAYQARHGGPVAAAPPLGGLGTGTPTPVWSEVAPAPTWGTGGAGTPTP